MLNVNNEGILKDLVYNINLNYNVVMMKCVFLPDNDLLPGMGVTKKSIKQEKIEYDTYISERYNTLVNRTPARPFALTAQDEDELSRYSERSQSLTASTTTSLKIKTCVYLKLAC